MGKLVILIKRVICRGVTYIKTLIPEDIKQKINLIIRSSNDSCWMQYAHYHGQRIFIFLAGFYQNLGDMAITYAQSEFLKKESLEAEIIFVPSTQTYVAVKNIKKFISPNDLITIIGGGNMDDNYLSLENARLHVVKSFPNNRIISFPQTISFSDSTIGIKSRKKSNRVYRKHPDITLFARERASFERCHTIFPGVNVEMVPDIVLSLKLANSVSLRNNRALLCLRNDKERQNNQEFNISIRETLEKIFDEVVIRDTVDIEREECTQQKYVKVLEQFWDLVRSCKIVVTDRLHCMLFCVITKTPCIAMDNSNHKISSVYDSWLRGVPFIKMIREQNKDEVFSAIESVSRKDYSGFKLNFDSYFEPLRRALNER